MSVVRKTMGQGRMPMLMMKRFGSIKPPTSTSFTPITSATMALVTKKPQRMNRRNVRLSLNTIQEFFNGTVNIIQIGIADAAGRQEIDHITERTDQYPLSEKEPGGFIADGIEVRSFRSRIDLYGQYDPQAPCRFDR